MRIEAFVIVTMMADNKANGNWRCVIRLPSKSVYKNSLSIVFAYAYMPRSLRVLTPIFPTLFVRLPSALGPKPFYDGFGLYASSLGASIMDHRLSPVGGQAPWLEHANPTLGGSLTYGYVLCHHGDPR